MTPLQVLEVVLAAKNHDVGIRAGRSFFCKPKIFYNLSESYEMYTGIYQAVILGEEPFFNVDIAHKSFPQSVSLLQVLHDRRIDPGCAISNKRDYNSVLTFLKRLRIEYKPPTSFGSISRQYVVLNIGLPASVAKFVDHDGKEMTVKNYFASRGYIIKYPELNCLQVGSAIKQITLPMELCSVVPHQVTNVSNSIYIFFHF